MRAAVGAGARWNDADRLAFEHGENGVAEGEHDVAHVAFGGGRCDAEVALDGGDGRLGAGVEIDGGLGGRRRRNSLASGAGMGRRQQPADLVLDGLDGGGCFLAEILLRRQLGPGQLLGERVGAVTTRQLSIEPVGQGAMQSMQ